MPLRCQRKSLHRTSTVWWVILCRLIIALKLLYIPFPFLCNKKNITCTMLWIDNGKERVHISSHRQPLTIALWTCPWTLFCKQMSGSIKENGSSVMCTQQRLWLACTSGVTLQQSCQMLMAGLVCLFSQVKWWLANCRDNLSTWLRYCWLVH